MSNTYLSPTHLRNIEDRLSNPSKLTESQKKHLLNSAAKFRLWQHQPNKRNYQAFWREYCKIGLEC